MSTRYPTVTGLTTFTRLEAETQDLLCDFIHTLVVDNELIADARSLLVNDKDFNPLLLFQRLAGGKTVIGKAALKAFLEQNGVDSATHVDLVLPGKQLSFEAFALKLFAGHLSSYGEATPVLRKIDAFPYPHLDRMLSGYLKVLIEAASREEALKQEFVEFAKIKDFTVRKAFVAMAAPGSKVLTVKDVKAFFSDNERLIKAERLLDGFFTPYTSGEIDGMTFEEFAKLFVRRGKTSVVQYSRYTRVRDSVPKNVEELTKSKFETSLSSTQSSERSFSAPVTAEFKTDYITADKVLTALTQVYLPEQLLLDQELEDLRIECISTVATTKTSLMALFRDCILRGSQETSLATGKHLHDFVNAVFPDVVSEAELE